MAVSVGANRMRTRVRGVWPEYAEATDTQLEVGRNIADLDVDRAKRVVAIGASVGAQMWPYLSPEQMLGKQIFLQQTPFEVIGVFQLYQRERDKTEDKDKEARRVARGSGNTGWDPFRWKNEAVVIPITTMFYEFQSGKFPDNSVDTVRIRDLTFRVGDLDNFEAALAQVRTALLKTHRGVDDFGFDTREDWFDRMNTQVAATRTSGGLIAGISLLVGGIGIANIMLASISERVREIGIRRAVGARGRDIFLQIIIESVSTALMGGLLGVFVGFGLIELIGYLAPSDSPPIVTAGSIILSVVFAAVAGVLSGIYPAMQASRLDPIQALRYE
jgi:putative ABC transport system permease protein